MKVYISGAITGTDDYMERFKTAEERLTKEGMSVINPAHANSYMPEDTTYEEYMKVSFCLLEMCDAVYMMKGWEKSPGANREYGYAHAKGMIIVEEGEEMDGSRDQTARGDGKSTVRLIDADRLVRDMEDASPNAWTARDMINLAKNAPIAYDVEKVVERLEQQRWQYQRRAREMAQISGGSILSEKNYGKANSYDHAIQIVRAGMEDRSSI